MARASDLASDVSAAIDAVPEMNTAVGAREADQVQKARRVEALSLRLAGVSYEQIGDRLDISAQAAEALCNRTLTRAENRNVDQMRELENARLDRAQAAIWNDVIKGDLKAVDTFLRISIQRSRINGLNAATKVDLNVGIRNEMEAALQNLEDLTKSAIVVQEKKAIRNAIEEDEEPWRPSS